jgi:uncharacterized protein YecE (DUF72 family)
MEKVHIGTSGFYYDHWIGCCYPEGISKRELLPAYARTFSTVEINSTFYHFPRQSSLLHWLEVTPDDFRFSLKAHRSITHYHRLDSGDLRAFMHQIRPLRPKLGVILFQLPPSLKLDLPLLDAFLSELPRGYRYAVEFRNDSWLDDVVFELLALHGVSLCINDFDRKETPWVATAGHVYIRMHGPLGRYRGKYPEAALQRLAGEIASLREEGRELYCYFNNDMEGFAWENARELEAMIGEAGR